MHHYALKASCTHGRVKVNRLIYLGAAWAALGSIGMTSCKPRTHNEAAKAKHNAGQITRAPEGPLWLAVDPVFAKRVISSQNEDPRFPVAFYSQHSGVVRRLQTWVDAIHGVLKERFPDQLVNVPAPQVLVQEMDSVNAYVPIFEAYTSLPVTFADSPVRARQSESPLSVFHPYSGRVFLYEDESEAKRAMSNMINLTKETSRLKAFLDFYSAEQKLGETTQNKCFLSFESDRIVMRGRCTVPSQTPSARSTRFAVAFTPNILVIHSGLLRGAEREEDFMRVVSHELGHFYRAHTSTPRSRNGFLYERKHSNLPEAPSVTTDPEMRSLGAKVRAMLGVASSTPVPGSRLNRFLFHFLRSAERTAKPRLSANCMSNSCTRKWSEVDSMAIGGDTAFAKLIYSDAVEPGMEGKYLSLERIWIEALRETPLAAGSPWSALDVAFSLLPESLLELTEETVQSTSWKNTFDLVEFQSKTLTSLMSESHSILEQIDARGLGVYTEEQEADDISLEFLSYVGVPLESAPEQMVRTWSTFLDREEREQCVRLRNGGWKSNGKPVLVPMGHWSNSHHDDCFRIFNLEREIDAHGFKIMPRPAKLIFSEAWKSFAAKKTNWGELEEH